MLLVVVMVNLGFWQLRRLDERRASNAEVRARTTMPAATIESVATPTTSGAALAALRFRAVRATGRYLTDHTIVIASRIENAGPGGWVVTPMRVGTSTVLVLRGFERLAPDGTLPAPAPPAGDVVVEGYALAIAGFDNIARRDLTTLHDGIDGALPVVLQARSGEVSAAGGALAAISLPSLDDGPHLSYAVQWFLFSTIAAAGYPLALRRAAAKREDEPAVLAAA